MKRMKAALAVLVIGLVSGCGAEMTAQSLVQQVRDAGYQCDPDQEQMGTNSGPVHSYKCGGAWGYVILDDDEANSETTTSWGQMGQTAASYGHGGFANPPHDDDWSWPGEENLVLPPQPGQLVLLDAGPGGPMPESCRQ